MTTETKQLIFQLVEKIKMDYKPEKIILFGSYAFGKPNKDSDIDLLIIKDTPLSFRKRWMEIYDMVCDIVRGIDFSPFVLTPKELEKRIKIGDQFFRQIIEKGEYLYAK